MILIAIVVLVVALRAGSGLPGRSYQRLQVRFPADAQGTVLPSPGSDVRLAGRRIGQTRAAKLDGGRPTLELQLDGGAPRLPADTRFVVRAQGLLGAKFVAVLPGDSTSLLADGGTVPARQTGVEVALSDVVGSFDPPTRAGTRRTVSGLGGGIAGRSGRLNDALDGLAGPLTRFSRALDPVLADGALPPLVRSTDRLTQMLDRVRGDIGAGIDPGERSLRATADAGPDIGRLLREGPDRVEGARRALVGVDPFLRRAEQFSVSAERFAKAAPAGLAATVDLLRGGRAPLRAALSVLRDARASVDPTVHLLRVARPELPLIQSVAETGREPAITLGRYGCDLSRFGRRWRSMLGYAPAGQSGPLGPLTMLRVTIASSGIPSAASVTPGSSFDGDIAPCETKKAP